jgi:hypothetical protein
LAAAGWPTLVVHALLVGSDPSVVPYMNAPPPPFQSRRNDAFPYCIAAVSPAAPYVSPKKSSPIDCAVPMSRCQASHCWYQAVPVTRSWFVPLEVSS